MITAIDHGIRKTLGISSVHYMVADVCAQRKTLWLPTTAKVLAEELGLTERAVSVAMNEMSNSTPPLLEKSENGHMYPTKHWHLALIGEPVELTTADETLAREVIEEFNKINSSRYHIPNNIALVKAILRVNNKLTLDHFKSVIVHKRDTWGQDEKMKEYNRPSTIFRSAKHFLRYLDDATMYWSSK